MIAIVAVSWFALRALSDSDQSQTSSNSNEVQDERAQGEADSDPPSDPAVGSRQTIDATGILDGAAFTMPSGNITCAMFSPEASGLESGYVRCDIFERDYADPPRPQGCQLDYGNSFYLDSSALLGCVGDTISQTSDLAKTPSLTAWFDPARDSLVRPAGSPRKRPTAAALAYGKTLVVGDLRCASSITGVTCTNSATGNGFRVARAKYRWLP